jgi:hypothetical protein
MNRLLRALWRRLLPPGGDVAVARETRPRRAHWLGYRPEPRRLREAEPEPHDLSPCDLQLCWCWDEPEMSWRLATRGYLSPGDLWLPYPAIADPTEP